MLHVHLTRVLDGSGYSGIHACTCTCIFCLQFKSKHVLCSRSLQNVTMCPTDGGNWPEVELEHPPEAFIEHPDLFFDVFDQVEWDSDSDPSDSDSNPSDSDSDASDSDSDASDSDSDPSDSDADSWDSDAEIDVVNVTDDNINQNNTESGAHRPNIGKEDVTMFLFFVIVAIFLDRGLIK